MYYIQCITKKGGADPFEGMVGNIYIYQRKIREKREYHTNTDQKFNICTCKISVNLLCVCV